MSGDPPREPPDSKVDDGSDRLAARVVALEQAVARLQDQVFPLLASASAPPRVREAAAVPPAPAQLPRPPAAPSAGVTTTRPFDGLQGVDLEGLVAGRWLNRIGLLAVAVGVSYFLRYALDNDWIGPRGQVAIGILLGSALLASVSWFLRRGYAYFADGMTGLGAAVLYLSLWAGGSYYHLFSLAAAFVCLAVVTAAMIVMAIQRNRQPVAVMALLGGFASPLLVSTGEANQIGLFTYLLVLNAALLPLAWTRDWSFIEAPAFFFTQGYFWGWYLRFYSADAFLATAAFAALFFSIFLVLPVLRSHRAGRMRVEQAIVLALNAGACLLAYAAMLRPNQVWALTAAALILAAVHLLAARLVPVREGRTDARLLLGGVALTLLTLVFPIRLNGPWISISWSVEGAVLIWAGFRAGVPAVRVLAFALFAIAGLFSAVASPPFSSPEARLVLNSAFLAQAVAVASFAAALWIAREHQAAISGTERTAFSGLGIAVNVLAVWALTDAVSRYFRPARFRGIDSDALAEGLSISVLWSLYASGLMFFGLRRAVAGLRWQALALFGMTTYKVFVTDLALLRGFYRIGSSIALGVVLLVVSFLYQRSLKITGGRPEA